MVYGIFDNLFEPLEKSPCTLAERVLLQIVHEFDHHLLGHLIRLDIGLHTRIGFRKKSPEPSQTAFHHPNIFLLVVLYIGIEELQKVDLLLDGCGLVISTGNQYLFFVDADFCGES